MSDTYTCAACRETFEKGWSDDEAQAELGETFPDFTQEECAVVCDDCYRLMMGTEVA